MKILSLFLIFICLGCNSTYEVIDIKTSYNSKLNFIYVKDDTQKNVYELVSVKTDSSIPNSKRILEGDKLKLKLIKRNNFRTMIYNSGINEFEKDTFINNIQVNKQYYSPNIDGLYYKKVK